MELTNKIKKFLILFGVLHRPKISLLIPFSTDDPSRRMNFDWLKRYWRCKLPHAELVVGTCKGKVFCKGEALNNALFKSTGEVLVVLDADALIDVKVIEYCAHRILEEQREGHNLWYVPYRYLYRLKKDISRLIIKSNPCHPLMPPVKPRDCDLDNVGDVIRYGNMYGAMITIFPRKALKYIKCFDEHFVGWGGEDMAFLQMMDGVFGKHKTTPNPVYHLHHPAHGKTHRERTWDNQEKPNVNNWKRTNRYHHARRNPSKMIELIEENYGYYQSRVRPVG